MDYGLDDSQTLLRDSARAFLAERFPVSALQALAVSRPVPDLWSEMAELGWTGLLVPEAYGGSDGNVLDGCLLVEQMGYAGLPSPFVHSAFVGGAVLTRFGSDAQRTDILPNIANGSQTVALAFAEASGEFAVPSIAAAATPTSASTFVLSGSKLFVKDADRATRLLVAARFADEIRLALVNAAGIELSPMETLSGERLFSVSLDGVEITADQILGDHDGEAYRSALELGALARTAEIVGLAQRVLDVCVEHVSVREQSGQPIGAFQAIQHSCADMVRNVSGARDMLFHAAWLRATGTPVTMAAGPAISTAKSYAGEMCLDVVRRGHQVMGAIGYCEEHPLHLLHKRIQAAALDFGDATEHLDQVADSLGLVAA